MFWKLDGVKLEDILPIPKAQPGRHFTTGHHALGNLTSTLDVKYAQMTYGDHYRKKVEAALECERQRCEDLLAEQKKKASAQKTLTSLKKSPASSQSKPKPRYDLNELRHHQRRCAALLFGARERGAHKLPVLVQWAPKRRESYYLMSERVYNDRLLMKMRADAGDSPLNFDFANTDGQTDDLMELQKFINKTSKDIKEMSFETAYKDYTHEFEDEERKILQEETNAENAQEESNEERKTHHRLKRKVVFSDHVTQSDTDAIDAKSLERSHKNARANKNKELDPSEIELNFDFGDESPDEGNISLDNKSDNPKKGNSKKRGFKNSRKGLSSPNLLSLLQETPLDNEYSSDFDSESDSDGHMTGDNEMRGLYEIDGELLSSPSAEKKKHRNKHCQHFLKQKTQDYYSKLPKLLKTSELKAKLPLKTRSKLEKIGKEANHQCMARHKIAYDRALTLARFRSLPFSHSFLSRKVSDMHTFSYFPGLPRDEKVLEKDGEESSSEEIKKKKLPAIPSYGREAIFGDIDMDDFYSQEDELIYFINPEELKNVVASTTSGEESTRNEDQISSRSVTTTFTSRANTAKPNSGVESDNS